MAREWGARHFVLAAVTLVVGLVIGGLGPRAEVRSLRARLEQLEDPTLDLELRRATGGEKGVRDLLHHFLAEYVAKDRGFGEDELDETKARSWKTKVLVRRRGEIALPVVIELRFEDAPPERISWDGATRWKRIEITRPRRLLAATVDPDDELLLDVNRLNNARRLESDPKVATSWGVRFLFALQQIFQLVGF